MSITETIQNAWEKLSERAQSHITRTRPALLQQWELIEEGQHYDTVTAATAAQALEIARGGVERANYPDCDGTIRIDIRARNAVTRDYESDVVTLEAPEPDCADGQEHDWQAPHEILGGCKENPGVWGKGGGVLIRQVCAHCGMYKVIDTWASHGAQQGFTDLSYEEADETSSQWIAERA
jgi:hypothetical protein